MIIKSGEVRLWGNCRVWRGYGVIVECGEVVGQYYEYVVKGIVVKKVLMNGRLINIRRYWGANAVLEASENFNIY